MGRETRNLVINRICERELKRCAEQYVRGRLIDIGCGPKPLKQLMAPFVSEHIGLDHENTFHDKTNVDLVGTAYEIPCEDDSFDSALCSAVLEHLEEPEAAIRECHRVLKPGGIAVYTVPFFWHLHEEPRDFFRYSRFGLQYLFEKAGFEIVELKALSGFWITSGQMTIYYLERFNRGPLRWIRVYDAISLLIQGICAVLDKIDRAEKWTWMYLVVARKKLPATEPMP